MTGPRGGLRRRSRRAGGLGVAFAVAVAALVLVSPAQAFRYQYSVAPGDGYTVGEGRLGSVTVTFNECVAAGQAIGVPVHAVVDGVGLSRMAHWDTERGFDGAVSFDPPTVPVRGAHESLVIIVPKITVGRPPGSLGAKFLVRLTTSSSHARRLRRGVVIEAPCVIGPAPTPPDGAHPCPSAAEHRVGVRVPSKNVAVPAPRVNNDCAAARASHRDTAAGR